MDFVGEGFAPALNEVRNDISRLASVVDIESLSMREQLQQMKPLSEDFMHCSEMMRIIARIFANHFDEPLKGEEIRNPNLNESIDTILKYEVIDPVPLEIDQDVSIDEDILGVIRERERLFQIFLNLKDILGLPWAPSGVDAGNLKDLFAGIGVDGFDPSKFNDKLYSEISRIAKVNPKSVQDIIQFEVGQRGNPMLLRAQANEVGKKRSGTKHRRTDPELLQGIINVKQD